MDLFQKFPEGMRCEIARAGSCGFIIFGASGDLSKRKLVPSLYLLFNKKSIPEYFFVVGFARTKMCDEDFRQKVKSDLTGLNDENFFSRIYYVSGDYDDDMAYQNLKIKINELDKKYKTGNNFIFSLAVPPSLYGSVTAKLVENGLMEKGRTDKPFHRVMIEKPFGRDYDSAVKLNSQLLEHLNDEQIFRVDHYLGKDTVQNILVFRFANSIFEPLWCSKCIDHVQINISEELGIENRAGYFDGTGLIRDMLQNHMLQLLSLVAMDPPASFNAECVRDEKQRVFESLVPFDPESIDENIIRGQYAKGKFQAYREENGVDPNSCIETFFATRIFIDNERWRGVPFYLKAGKRLDKKDTSISVVFKETSLEIFNDFTEWQKNKANVLTFKIQPEQGVNLRFQVKVPGLKHCLAPLNLNFDYMDLYESESAGDYASVILDCMLGDQMLFWRKDGIESTWKFLTPVLKQWESCHDEKINKIHYYPAGSTCPMAANDFIQKFGHEWIE